MDINQHTTPEKLERYAFLWSEARLLIAAGALFLGGVPPVLFLFRSVPGLYGTLSSLLTLSWIISGLVSAYLIYRWNKSGQTVFGGKEQMDTIAFFVNVVSGFNLGLTGLTGRNIGMSISSNYMMFVIVGVVYLVAAWHLWNRWKARSEKVF